MITVAGRYRQTFETADPAQRLGLWNPREDPRLASLPIVEHMVGRSLYIALQLKYCIGQPNFSNIAIPVMYIDGF
jgi:hypothetical protein